MGTVSFAFGRWYEIDTDQRMRTGTITMSSTYANSGTASNSGDTIADADILKLMPTPNDLTRADKFLLFASASGHTAYVDRAHKKIRVLLGGTEVSNNTNLSAVTFDYVLIYEDTHWIDDNH